MRDSNSISDGNEAEDESGGLACLKEVPLGPPLRVEERLERPEEEEHAANLGEGVKCEDIRSCG